MTAPTRGATETNSRNWKASPALARFVRALVFLAPIVAAWAAVKTVSPVLWKTDGIVGLGAFLLQALPVASVSAHAADRVARRFLPLATLLGMSLTFPDNAPSRFKVALRAGTVSKLSERLEEARERGLGDDVGVAAERAIELVTMLGRHERLTRGHTERVRAFSDMIGVELGLDDHDRDLLAWAALLHDIGKLTVPAQILNGKGRPSDEEWKILQNHPAAGEEFVAPMAEWLGDWRLATSQHHERWDGNGYPYGLAGNDISLSGRIVAVADAYDVITSRRSYKAPMSADAARAELVACAGTQFDPEIVRAMLRAAVGTGSQGARVGWLSQVPELGRLTGTSGFAGGLAGVAGGIAGSAAAAVIGLFAGAFGGFDGAPEVLALQSPVEVTTTVAPTQSFDTTTTMLDVDADDLDLGDLDLEEAGAAIDTEASDDPAEQSHGRTDDSDGGATEQPSRTTTSTTTPAGSSPSTTTPAPGGSTTTRPSSTTTVASGGALDPVVDPLVDDVLDPLLEPVLDPVTEALDPVLDPLTEDVVEPVLDPILDPLLDPLLGDDDDGLLGLPIGLG